MVFVGCYKQLGINAADTKVIATGTKYHTLLSRGLIGKKAVMYLTRFSDDLLG